MSMENIEVDHVLYTVAPFTRLEHIIVGCLYMCFCFVGVITNLLTALTFYKDTKLVTSGKPWLHIALAVANIGVVGPSPFPASSSFSGKWLYGETMCKMYAFEGMFVGILAIGLVVAMCIERYAVGGKSSTDSMGWFYVSAIVLNVGNAFFWACMPLLGWSRYAIENTGVSCALDWKDPDAGFASYLITLEIVSFVIPLAVAALCLYQNHSSSKEPTAGSSGTDYPQVVVTTPSLSGFTEDQLKTLCYIFLLFVFVGWGPFALLCTTVVMTGTATGLSMLASTIPPLACKLLVSAYPLAYAIASPRFRDSFCSFFRAAEQKQE